MRWLSITLLLFFVYGCSIQQSSSADLQIISLSADGDTITTSIYNQGDGDATDATITFNLDEIYYADPNSITSTISLLAAGGFLTVETTNSLTSEGGVGQHYLKADTGSDTSALYYYDGAYTSAYNYINNNKSTWISTIRDRCQLYYNWPASGNYNMQLLDDMTSLGRRSTRTILGTSTSVLSLDLEAAADGYSAYYWDGDRISYNTSREIVYHEYVHAFHREYVVQYGSWNNAPTWFKEGIAVFTAGQGPNRVKYYAYRYKNNYDYTQYETREEILEGVCGGSSHTHESNDYAGDYLAIQYIIDNYSYATLRSIIYDNANGEDIEDAIVDNLSNVSSWTSFKSKLRSYTDDVLDDYWDHLTSSSVSAADITMPPESELID